MIIFQGQEKQSRRSNIFQSFSNSKKGILLTTGMAERGWDIPDVRWIIQYDPPHRPNVSFESNFFANDYIHTIVRKKL